MIKTKTQLIKRIKSYSFWTSVIALIPVLVQTFGVDILPNNYSTAINALLAFFVAIGIVNNPTTENPGFSDDKTKEIEE